ncbi:hypothetical protein BKA80DRAFT_142747 [Phyllosticta citrichinensis]
MMAWGIVWRRLALRPLLEHSLLFLFFVILLRCLVLFDSSIPPCRVNLDSTRRPPKVAGWSFSSSSLFSVCGSYQGSSSIFFSLGLYCTTRPLIERRLDFCSVLFCSVLFCSVLFNLLLAGCMLSCLFFLSFFFIFFFFFWLWPSVDTAWDQPRCSISFLCLLLSCFCVLDQSRQSVRLPLFLFSLRS